ncbi:ATP-binding protein [Pseudaeromonas paramecii]|uniref:histidine kinase n=1 Tax=Pseudaeromonas paramecii TaxID=2138166 RepID=A0ABP8Q7D0_9GAMM
MSEPLILSVCGEPQLQAQFAEELTPLFSLFGWQTASSLAAAYECLSQASEAAPVALVLCEQQLEDGEGSLLLGSALVAQSGCQRVLWGRQQASDKLIEAVNRGSLDHVLLYPWAPGTLLQAVRQQLTDYVARQQDEPLRFAPLLDGQRLLRAQLDRQMAAYRQGFMDYTHYTDEALSAAVIRALYQFFEGNDETRACRRYSPNHVLTRQGERNEFLWFIAQGEVVLKKRDAEGQEWEVVRYQQGALVGGMSFVTGEPAFTTGVTLTAAEVIKLDKALFAKVMQAKSDLLPLFTHLLLRHFNRRLQNSIQTKMALQKTLASLEQAQAQLVEREKLAVLGQLVAGVAHELNNPVAAILRGADTLQAQLPGLLMEPMAEPWRALAASILQQAMQVTPLSTATVRQRAAQAEHYTGDRTQARQLVQMQLDDPALWQRQFAPLSAAARQTQLARLDDYYQMGNFLHNIHVCARRIADLVKGLKQYARQDNAVPQRVDLLEGLEDTLTIFENRLKQLTLERHYDETRPKVLCYPIALQQVWTNLIANALDAVAELGREGRIQVRSQVYDEAGAPWIRIEVEDNGHGIAPELQARIFELNFTTKRDGNFGLGIGLHVCQQIIAQHQGRIAVRSVPGRYTCMAVCLPVTPAELLPPAP